MSSIALSFLLELLQEKGSDQSLSWLEQKAQKIQQTHSSTPFFLAFSQASRFFTKDKLVLSEAQSQQAGSIAPDFDPSHWDQLQTARTYLLLHLPQAKETWLQAMHQLFETGDLHEQAALYAALPLMPFPEEMLPRAIDGCRTNMTLVFDAIALHNPFPATYFPALNWNQMVLKAIFMQRPLYQIQQLDERRNPTLAEIASDFAHERWAAGRKVMPELWRLVTPFVNDQYLADLQRVMHSSDPLEQLGGALALFHSDAAPSQALLADFPALLARVESGEVTWEKIGQAFQAQEA